jgi:hypothetical protein
MTTRLVNINTLQTKLTSLLTTPCLVLILTGCTVRIIPPGAGQEGQAVSTNLDSTHAEGKGQPIPRNVSIYERERKFYARNSTSDEVVKIAGDALFFAEGTPFLSPNRQYVVLNFDMRR